MKRVLITVLLLTSPAFAQQTPPEVALQVNSIVGTWAQALVQQSKTIEDLQKQIKQMQEDQKKCKK